jgi:hypothetical protein
LDTLGRADVAIVPFERRNGVAYSIGLVAFKIGAMRREQFRIDFIHETGFQIDRQVAMDEQDENEIFLFVGSINAPCAWNVVFEL